MKFFIIVYFTLIKDIYYLFKKKSLYRNTNTHLYILHLWDRPQTIADCFFSLVLTATLKWNQPQNSMRSYGLIIGVPK